MIEKVDDLDNAAGAARPTTKHIPDYQEFITFAHYLRQLQLENLVAFNGELVEKEFFLDIDIKQKNLRNPKIKKLFKMLHTTPRTKIRFVEKYGRPNTIQIVGRSFIGVLYYLAKSVQVSEDDVKNGIVIIPKYPDGRLFNWGNVTQGMMRIYSSVSFPKHATTYVYYRHRWYYIADDDIDSKETLAMLEELYALQSGLGVSQSPLITIPL
jgi:hypothetical protein